MTETEIYYFSGTGNSLIIAKDLAEKTNGQIIRHAQHLIPGMFVKKNTRLEKTMHMNLRSVAFEQKVLRRSRMKGKQNLPNIIKHNLK